MTEDDAPAADARGADSDGRAPTNAPADAAPELFGGGDTGTTPADATGPTTTAPSTEEEA
ncbi:hypothetical protein [Halobaculum magnesiiphilum]|uniref:Uncharacterized protein n=1 Tax=Halobaculum magnesiiphilum TaxID=1017351 RepID=A0A8T8WBF6_9EURY|nr:hypothetical protein [Halobaculum magnesiiphilum]QZP37170.1 hypothetical protein K6T50_12875 [Halobaculum magnesiiphilum]